MVKKLEGPSIFKLLVGANFFSPIENSDLTSEELKEPSHRINRLYSLLTEVREVYQEVKPFNLRVDVSQLENEVIIKKVYSSFDAIVAELQSEKGQANMLMGASDEIRDLMARLMKQYQ